MRHLLTASFTNFELMGKYLRYVMYMLIGVAIYYFSGADENPEVLKEFKSTAPLLILVVVISLMFVKYFKSKQEKDQNSGDQQ